MLHAHAGFSSRKRSVVDHTHWLARSRSSSLALPAARVHKARRPGDRGGHNPALRGAFVATGRFHSLTPDPSRDYRISGLKIVTFAVAGVSFSCDPDFRALQGHTRLGNLPRAPFGPTRRRISPPVDRDRLTGIASESSESSILQQLQGIRRVPSLGWSCERIPDCSSRICPSDQ